MQKFKTTIEKEVQVTFQDPGKARAFFIESNWRETFYSLDTMEEVTDCLIGSFINTDFWWSAQHKNFIKEVEGFPTFIRDNEAHSPCAWRVTEDCLEYAGDIRIVEAVEFDIDSQEVV